MSDVRILRRHGQRAYELARDLKGVVYDTSINSEEAQFLCSELQREVSRLASQIPPNVDPSEFADQGSDERETVDELGEVKALVRNRQHLNYDNTEDFLPKEMD